MVHEALGDAVKKVVGAAEKKNNLSKVALKVKVKFDNKGGVKNKALKNRMNEKSRVI